MNMPEGQCPHIDMHFHVHHQAFHDSNLHYLEITGKCKICGKQAEFRGMPIGLSPGQPTMAAPCPECRLFAAKRAKAVRMEVIEMGDVDVAIAWLKEIGRWREGITHDQVRQELDALRSHPPPGDTEL